MEKVSIILTTYNSRENFEVTIASVLQQDYPEIEIVVKDGGSTDGTVKAIREYKKRLGSRLVWISEKDNGIYDAMNKGYQISNGDIIVFFNDIFTTKYAVSHMVKAIQEGGPECMGAHADLVLMNGDRVVRKWKMGKGYFRTGWLPGHPTMYVKRDVYEIYGLYDTRYRCSSDYEFMIRAFYGREERLAYVPETIVRMFYGGMSTGGLKNYLVSLTEGHEALKRNGVKFAWWIDFRRIIRVLLQFRH